MSLIDNVTEFKNVTDLQTCLVNEFNNVYQPIYSHKKSNYVVETKLNVVY